MKHIKTLLIYIVMLAVIVPHTALSVSAESGSVYTENDVETREKLETMNIVPKLDKDLSEFITRGEMVSFVVKYLGIDTALPDGNGSTPFTDVSPYDKNIGAYNALYRFGCITGDAARAYRPNDYLTYNEAMIIILRAAGYEPVAAAAGGYPNGYLSAAARYGFMSGLRGGGDNLIPLYDLYLMIDNSLDAKSVTQQYGAPGVEQYEISSNETVLENLHSIKIVNGVVTGTENTKLYDYDSDDIGQYQVEIDKKAYDTDNFECEKYLGQNVDVYLRENSGDDYTAVYIEPRNNTFVKIDADDLLPEKTTENAIYYENSDGKVRHITIDGSDIKVIYNGKSRSGYGLLKNTLPENGYIEGLDNDGDGVTEVLFVMEFKNYVVGTTDIYAETLTDIYTNETLTLDSTEDEIRIYDADGKRIKLSDIVKNDVLTVFETDNASRYKLITVYRSSASVSGKIEQLSDDTYVINGEEYEAAANFKNYVENKHINALQINDRGVFYLDREGKIADFRRDEAATGKLYAICVLAESFGGFDGIGAKLFNQNGEWETVKFADRVKVDGVSLRSGANGFLDYIPLNEVIMYEKSDEEITSVDTKAQNVGSTSPDDGNLQEIAAGNGFAIRHGVAYDSTNKANFVVINNNVTVFYTPETYSGNTDDYRVNKALSKFNYGTTSDFSNKFKISSYAAYKTAPGNIDIAACVHLKGADVAEVSRITQLTNFCVVTKITRTMDADGEAKYLIKYLEDGKEGKVLANKTLNYSYSNDAVAADSQKDVSFGSMALAIGDVIRFSVDENGNADSIDVAYRMNQQGALKDKAWLQLPERDLDFNTQWGAAVGYAEDIDDSNNILSYSCGGDVYYISAQGAKVSVYRREDEQGDTAALSDIRQGDLLLIRSSTGYSARCSQILIIR